MAIAPYLIQFEQTGEPEQGFLTSTQMANHIPFAIRRVFWTLGIPATAMRGQHANRLTEEVLVAVSGVIRVTAETANGQQTFELTSPGQGLYIPALCWTDLAFQDNAVSLCLASTDFDEADYIRDYTEFKKLLIALS